MNAGKVVRVAVNGYGVIGKRVADAVAAQDDMELSGVIDVVADWRARAATRRATDPWESHEGGIVNTLVPEADIPSHQGPDAQTVDPQLDVVTMAVKVPETLAHLHYWSVELTRAATKEEVLAAFRSSTRTDAALGIGTSRW